MPGLPREVIRRLEVIIVIVGKVQISVAFIEEIK